MSEPHEVRQLRSLVQDRALKKDYLSSPEFELLHEELGKHLNSDNPYIKMNTLSVLGRASSVSKPAEFRLKPLISQSLSSPITQSLQMSDGDDRYYFAKAISISDDIWVYDYAVKQIVEEDVAEKARTEWVKIAIKHSTSLEKIITDINGNLKVILPKLGLDVDGIAKRLLRITSSLETPLATEDMLAGDYLGDQLYKLFITHNERSGCKNRELRLSIATHQIETLIKIIRLNIAVNNDPKIYQTVGAIMKWWHPASPPQELSKLTTRVAEIGCKTLHIYARQGLKRDLLRSSLVDAFGENVIGRITKIIVENDPSLDTEISYWLSTGKNLKKAQSNQLISHQSSIAFEEQLAHLMVALTSSFPTQIELDTINSNIGAVFPEEADLIDHTVNGIKIVNQWVRALARSKSLDYIGQQSAHMKFDPALHETFNNVGLNSDVTVVTPGVIKKNEGRPDSIILKIKVRAV